MNGELRVNKTLAVWQDRRAELQRHSQRLERALADYAAGKGPMPNDLRERVHALRDECDQLFKEVLEAVAQRNAESGGKDGM